MNELKVVGTQEFMEVELPIIEGGFGEGFRVMTAHMIAQIHGVSVKHINELTNNNINEFEEEVDVLNLLKVGINHLEIKNLFGIDLPPVTKNFFIYSEQGYMALVGLMRSDEAREIRKKVRREYFSMRQIINSDEQKLAMLTLNIYKGGQGAIASAKELTDMEVSKATEPLKLEIKVKDQLIAENEPKVSYFDKILSDSNSTMSVSQIAKDYGLSAVRLNEILHEEKVQYKTGGVWLLYANHVTKGYTKSKTWEKNGKSGIHTYFTQRGRVFIHNLLEGLGIVALEDK